jgi:two-component system chemotaxis response regulator CheB
LLVDEHIHVAPGDAHLCLVRSGVEVRIRLDRRKAPSGCLPSCDPMFGSVASAYGRDGVGVLLSGMGRDGAHGARQLVEQGGAILAQDRHSAAIWGMPRAVAEAGLASAVLPPAELARRIGQRAEFQPWR